MSLRLESAHKRGDKLSEEDKAMLLRLTFFYPLTKKNVDEWVKLACELIQKRWKNLSDWPPFKQLADHEVDLSRKEFRVRDALKKQFLHFALPNSTGF